ncbi:Peptidyl-prolyl cis-trans isomerase, PpiC-type [Sesbania bispinosa]|nr:Peptidyl-prolyl cis-trans isomerase, PpiC-type [Sesbania bispinosa]
MAANAIRFRRTNITIMITLMCKVSSLKVSTKCLLFVKPCRAKIMNDGAGSLQVVATDPSHKGRSSVQEEKGDVREKKKVEITASKKQYVSLSQKNHAIRTQPSSFSAIPAILTANIDSDPRRKMSSSNRQDEVRASHILAKHQGSRRKSSWKDPEGRFISNTTRDSAAAQLNALRDVIISGKANFDDVAFRFSDCSSAKRGGDLGPFHRGQMQKPFEEATFALKVGEISDIVDTDSGVHIIMRTGRARLVIDGEEEAGMGDMAMQVQSSYLAPIDKLPNPRQVQVYQLSCGVFGWLEERRISLSY